MQTTQLWLVTQLQDSSTAVTSSQMHARGTGWSIICWPIFHIEVDVLSLQRHTERGRKFIYLGCMLTSSCQLTHADKIQQRIRFASAAFGRLSASLQPYLSVLTKLAEYKAVCVSILLYGCYSWKPYCHHIKALETFHKTFQHPPLLRLHFQLCD